MAAASRNRPSSDTDRLVVARISGIALRHARWHEPTEDETAAAVAELCEIAGNRPDLLPEQAGILLGFHEGGLDEPRAKAAASFCIAAGPDQDLIPRWAGSGPSWRAGLLSAGRPVHRGVRERVHYAGPRDESSRGRGKAPAARVRPGIQKPGQLVTGLERPVLSRTGGRLLMPAPRRR
jgi:hypothetical protein